MSTYDEAMRQWFIIYDGAMISRVSTEIAEAFNKKICDESKTKCLFYSHHHEFSHPALNKDIVFLFMGNTSLKFWCVVMARVKASYIEYAKKNNQVAQTKHL